MQETGENIYIPPVITELVEKYRDTDFLELPEEEIARISQILEPYYENPSVVIPKGSPADALMSVVSTIGLAKALNREPWEIIGCPGCTMPNGFRITPGIFLNRDGKFTDSRLRS